MKANKTNVAIFFEQTKAELNWVVVSFDRETMRRELCMAGFDMMHGLETFMQEGAKGNVCILTNKDGYDFLNRFENENGRRVTFEDMKPYRIVMDKDFTNNRYGLRTGKHVIA